jgi:hypothetical protein
MGSRYRNKAKGLSMTRISIIDDNMTEGALMVYSKTLQPQNEAERQSNFEK